MVDVANQSDKSSLPRAVVVTALVLGVLLVAGVATLGVLSKLAESEQREAADAAKRARRAGALALPPVPASHAASAECASVLNSLPASLRIGNSPVPRRPLAAPAPQAAVAWGDADHDPVIVRCGLDAPAELTATSQLADVSGVSWLRISEGGAASWVVVDRPVYVALTAPADSGTGPVQDISAVLAQTLPKLPVFPTR